jgi:ribosomal protein S18 acetylase RimI-like enzyme
MYCQGCGFEVLAELIYLDRKVPHASAAPMDDGFQWETYSAQNHDAFARAVAASYVDSLDCPRLSGCRSIEDVLAGHKAAGEFDPALWMLARVRENGAAKEAGVMLLTRSMCSDTVELVYLGVAPAYRGQKLGDAMMRRAFATAASIGSRRLSLAVDSKNEPALRLYRRHGMSRLCSRLALLRDLRAGRKREESVTQQ